MTVHRGRVSAVDTAGVFVRVAALGPDVVGPLAWTGVTPKVGDPVLLADTGDGASPDLVVVGVLNSATGGTDNAVARFDGTGGAIQKSPVTITDDGAIQTFNATSDFHFGAASGNSANVYVTAGSFSGHNAALFFRANGYKRWFVGKEASTESGSNAGSNFRIWRYNDDGTSIGQAFGISRATGRVTVDAAGATAGVELGSSGPRIMAGTGSPESVVTAPVGSLWLRTDSATTLYVKQTGTGNTGWVAK